MQTFAQLAGEQLYETKESRQAIMMPVFLQSRPECTFHLEQAEPMLGGAYYIERQMPLTDSTDNIQMVSFFIPVHYDGRVGKFSAQLIELLRLRTQQDSIDDNSLLLQYAETIVVPELTGQNPTHGEQTGSTQVVTHSQGEWFLAPSDFTEFYSPAESWIDYIGRPIVFPTTLDEVE